MGRDKEKKEETRQKYRRKACALNITINSVYSYDIDGFLNNKNEYIDIIAIVHPPLSALLFLRLLSDNVQNELR